MKSSRQLLAQGLIAASMLAGTLAIAQTEPTIDQIYTTAKAGRLEDAQVMVQQVLLSHPKSAKAFYVQAELYARQGNLDRARASLEKAEQFAPGLPFAKPESIQELRNQLNGRTVSHPAPVVQYSSPVPPHSTGSWLLPLLLAGGVIFAGYLIFRRRSPNASEPVAAIGNPQNFGNGGIQPGYPQPGYPQGYPPGYAPQPSLGGRIAGGVATGLAVGAGVLAAEAIGRSLMGDHNSASAQSLGSSNGFEPLSGNTDMGGNDFGVSDTSSWDDAGGGDFGGGGGDWDN